MEKEDYWVEESVKGRNEEVRRIQIKRDWF